MKSKILRALGHADGYVSGQELSGMLDVSRTAVWKVINQLKEEGYEIESVPRKGYRILSRPDVVTKEAVASRLETKWAGRQICSLPTVDSTNNEAADWQRTELWRGRLCWRRNRPGAKAEEAVPG